MSENKDLQSDSENSPRTVSSVQTKQKLNKYQKSSFSPKAKSVVAPSHNVKVVIRVRPLNEREKVMGIQKSCIQVEDDEKIIFDKGAEQKNFKFDFVADIDTNQEDVFLKVAQPIADSCIQGYNGTIFAYGQTGSGKTYTIQGPAFTTANGEEQLISITNSNDTQQNQQRGLMQRSFEHIFQCIENERKEGEKSGCEVNYLIKSSYLEIYNEQVMDLLDPSSINLHIREDIKMGVYVEGLIEEPIQNVNDMIALITKGSRNRHVGSTNMNKESSRSHSVLTTQIESKTMNQSGVWQIKNSCFHIIDLAGSERSKLTQAEGQRLKEAGMINKSLSALGIVINSLVDISEGKTRHVHYRDSKLTFLLRDSLGGNSKTVIIANITQAQISQNETLSTLQFAQRAKLIKNKAVINEESSGTIQILKNEIRRLKQEMAEVSNHKLQLEHKINNLGVAQDQSVCKNCMSDTFQKFESNISDEMLVGQSVVSRVSSDSKKLIDRVMKLENLLTANLDNLTSSHKYFQVESDKKVQSFKRMQLAIEASDKQSQRDKMIIKFRDQRIQKLEQSLSQSSNAICNQCELTNEHINQVKKERDEWRDMYEKQTNTLAAKLFAEKEELQRQNQILMSEIKQTPESLTAQLRSFNELTDTLNQYLKEHCEQKTRVQVQDLEMIKESLQEQVATLQRDIENQLLSHQKVLKDLATEHNMQQSQLKAKLQQAQEKQMMEQSILQIEAKQELNQIKQDLQALSENEIQQTDAQQNLQSKIENQQNLLKEAESRELILNEKIVQLIENLTSLQVKLIEKEESHKNQLVQSDKLKIQIKSLQDTHNREIQQFETTLLVEKSRGDALREAENELMQTVANLQTRNEDLSKQLFVSLEATQELGALIYGLESRMQLIIKEHDIKIKSANTAHNQLKEQYEILKHSYSELEKEKKTILENTTHKNAEIDALKQQTVQLKQEQDSLNQKNEEQNQQLSQLQSLIRDHQAESRKDLEEMNSKNQSICQELLQKQNELLKIQELYFNIQNSYKILQNTHSATQEQLSESISKMQSLEIENSQFDSALRELKDQKLRVETLLKTSIVTQETNQQQELISLRQKHQTEQDLLHSQLNLSDSKLDSQQKLLTKLQTEAELQKQQLLNQLKSTELDNMQLQGQIMILKSEQEQIRQNYSRQLEQIQSTLKSSLDVEKEAARQQVQAQFQDQIVEKEQQLCVEFDLRVKLLIQQHEIELRSYTKQLQNNRLQTIKKLYNQVIQVKSEYQQFKIDIQNLLQWQQIAPSKQLIGQIKPNTISISTPNKQSNEVEKIAHQKAIISMQSTISSLKSEVDDLLEQLNEYKGLTAQLQQEKQAQLKVSSELLDRLKLTESQHAQQTLISRRNESESYKNQDQQMLDKAMICAMREEMQTLRNQMNDVTTELSRYKAKNIDLLFQLKQTKESVQRAQEREIQIQNLLEKEQDQSQSFKLQLQLKETETKEIVKALKQVLDEKKILEQQNDQLVRKQNEFSEGHSNQQQKIQYHLKIKEEYNKLREENYTLKEEKRRSKEEKQATDLDILALAEYIDYVIDQFLTVPSKVQKFKLDAQISEVVLRRAGTIQIPVLIVEYKKKFSAIIESIQNSSNAELRPVPVYKTTQAIYGPVTQQPRVGSNINIRQQQQFDHLRNQQNPLQLPQDQSQIQQELPSKQQSRPVVCTQVSGSQQEKENKLNSAAAFLQSLQQRNNLQKK